MRIRTNGDKAFRTDTIERISDHYDRNKTDSLMLAADQIPAIHKAIEDILASDSFTVEQRREIAKRFSRARGIQIDVETNVTVSVE